MCRREATEVARGAQPPCPSATLRRVETEIARLARDWEPGATSDIWHPLRTAGLGDRDALGAWVRAGLQVEPELVDSWAAYSQDKRAAWWRWA